MQIRSVHLLVATILVAQTEADASKLPPINKCCGPFQMLSGDGSSCVNVTWQRNHTLGEGAGTTLSFHFVQQSDAPWVRRWLPPGVSLQRVGRVHLGYLDFLKSIAPQRRMWTVDESAEWDVRQAEAAGNAYWRRRVVFNNNQFGSVMGPEPKPLFQSVAWGLGGYRALDNACVDAAQSPLGPFALIAKPDCVFDACVIKCCHPHQVVVFENGSTWGCRGDSRAADWPHNSSLALLLRSKAIDYVRVPESTFIRRPGTCRPVRLPPEDELVAHLLQRRYHDYMWSTWASCVDFEVLPNGTLRDTIFYCPELRITRGFFWLLRHLCFVSVSLLVVALASVASNSSMRVKAHGWCLACHASCLLGFNLGQVAYNMTISDQVNAFGFVPLHLKNACRTFAFPMYFLLMAANCWLTALCFNMALGFRKLQMVRSGRGKDWKRFLGLSAFAWGLPALMCGLCVFSYEKNEEKRKWFSPTLSETRTCFHEVAYEAPYDGFYVFLSSHPSGSALFYYAPVGILIVVNAICIERTLKKVQFLRRGNSVLHREEDNISQTPRKIDGANAQGKSTRTKEAKHFTLPDNKTIKSLAKMLLMTGVIEIAAEIIGWITVPSLKRTPIFHLSTRDIYFLHDHMLAYRTTGFATDCFRAACVVWWAAPDGGYWDALRQWLGNRGGKKGRNTDMYRRKGRP